MGNYLIAYNGSVVALYAGFANGRVPAMHAWLDMCGRFNEREDAMCWIEDGELVCGLLHAVVFPCNFPWFRLVSART